MFFHKRKFIIKTWMRRKIARYFGFQKPTFYPYISGDGFRALAHHILDQYYDFEPKKVSKGEVVFVRGDFLRGFFEKYHPLISENYILISHNEDFTITQDFGKMIDEKIIHWFGQNAIFEHEKISALPIGLENYLSFSNGCKYDDFASFASLAGKAKKNNRVLYGFYRDVRIPERVMAYQALKESEVSDELERVNRREYFNTLKNYSFVASPVGAGVDCHRTWEAMYLRVMPIVTRNPLTEYFFSIGLPLLLIDDWSDLKQPDSNMLEKYYEENYYRFDSECLKISYWYDLIFDRCKY